MINGGLKGTNLGGKLLQSNLKYPAENALVLCAKFENESHAQITEFMQPNVKFAKTSTLVKR